MEIDNSAERKKSIEDDKKHRINLKNHLFRIPSELLKSRFKGRTPSLAAASLASPEANHRLRVADLP